MNIFHKGQRWISELELNLGMGIVQSTQNRRVEIYFPAAECSRLYAISSAPLKRVEFKQGEEVKSRDGIKFIVKDISAENNVLIYIGDNIRLPETELDDSLNFSSPMERFQHRLFDDNHSFNLRYRALKFYHNLLNSRIRGFTGARIDLIDHQLFIADRISSRLKPRALLSDETGLGKTIEACLVLHHLLLTGRIKRILVLLPDSLILQWFVELLRRFNLVFQIIDNEFLDSKAKSNYTGNIFLDEQLCLCSLNFLTQEEDLSALALDAKWDMLVVDEAHHLQSGSTEYNLVKSLGQMSNGMLLLTATPEQYGFQSHFDRLHLLDPDRYFDFEKFLNEEKQYLALAGVLDKFLAGSSLSDSDLGLLNIPREKLENSTEESRLKFSDEFIDRFGPGRVIFQNTREIMKNFPPRIVHLMPLAGNPEDVKQLKLEFESDNNRSSESVSLYADDKRIEWLVSFLKENKSEKILLICHTKEKAIAIDKRLKESLKIETALFHEELSLLQRDKNANRFASETGARILLCSEIGSEGRNFQFAHNLVLFDLPLNPELLEQRIGRLDRIGQKQAIHIYVPFVKNSIFEYLAKWYDEGLNIFHENLPGVHAIFKSFENNLTEILEKGDSAGLEQLLADAKEKRDKTLKNNRKGKDHLLSFNSFQPDKAREIIKQIEATDSNPEIENFMREVFEYYGIEEEYISNKTSKLNLSLLTTETFPLPVVDKNNLIITFDRDTALTHEDYEFLTPDHPMVFQTIEFLLSSESGNCSIGVLQGVKTNETLILLEAIFILECLSPPYLQIEQYLPPSPIRTIVNHLNKDCNKEYSTSDLEQKVKDCNFPDILNHAQFKDELLPAMLKECQSLAEQQGETIRKTAIDTARNKLDREINRVTKLQELNHQINPEEIIVLKKQQASTLEIIKSSRIRLDSVRVILSPGFINK